MQGVQQQQQQPQQHKQDIARATSSQHFASAFDGM